MRAILPYRWLWVISVMFGSITALPLVWTFADIANALMAIPNFISLIALNGVIVAETHRHLFTPVLRVRRLRRRSKNR
jgi:AGCS family alanine or glycine:cation symporter